MSRKNKSPNIFLILIVLGTVFVYRDAILKFLFKSDQVQKISKIISDDTGVKVSKLKGNVRITKNDIDYFELNQSTLLETGDTIRTSRNSFVTIAFGTQLQNQFTLGAGSVIEIESLFSNEEGVRTGTSIKILEGAVRSELTQLEGTEFKITTDQSFYLAKEGSFLIREIKDGDDILVVKNGSVERGIAASEDRPVVKKGEVFFFRNGLKIPISDPKLSKKIQSEFDDPDFSQEETLYTIYSKIIGKIDEVKIILTIKDRLSKMKEILRKKIKSDIHKINRVPVKLGEHEDKYKIDLKNAEEDIKCLKNQLNCVLKSEAILLEEAKL